LETDMDLSKVFDERLIRMDLEARDKEGVFAELVGELAALRPELDQEKALAVILDREAKMNTSVAPGVAVAHGYLPGAEGVIGAIGFSPEGIEYDAPDRKPVHLVFLILLGDGAREQHLRVLSRILGFVNADALTYIRDAATPRKVHEILSRLG
jgi:mannitol/fructose-specific phosphotransferase system IIA component (Ntr-type)